MKKLLAEGVGTMFLVLLACGSAALAGPSIGGLGIGLCFGLVLVCLCYCLGNISGCHVNPAVSFAMFLAGRMSGKEFAGYVVAQLLGATVGAGFLYWLMNMAPGFNFGGITAPDYYLATNVLQPGATSSMALLVEGLLTFFFVLIVLGATDANKGFGKFAGLAIGLALGLVRPCHFLSLGMGRLLDYGCRPRYRRCHRRTLLGRYGRKPQGCQVSSIFQAL